MFVRISNNLQMERLNLEKGVLLPESSFLQNERSERLQQFVLPCRRLLVHAR